MSFSLKETVRQEDPLNGDGMGGFFYNFGKMVGPTVRKADWVLRSMTGTESEVLKAELAVGKDLASAYVKENPLDPDPEVEKFLNAISVRLLECVTNREREFSFLAVQREELNAIAMPGGYIFIMRPLLELCQWDADEIAFVLGHEMGHVILKHTMNRIMANTAITAACLRFPLGGLLGMGILHTVTELLDQGYSRDNELEADTFGAKIAGYAGFDPHAGKRALTRLGAIPTEKWFGSTYFSSHPELPVRLQNLDKTIRQLQVPPAS
jgi:predicted Zn-dependent protease